MEAPATGLLDAASVLVHLRERGVIGPTDNPRVTPLGGGVSNIVLRVEAEPPLVVKQALPRLRVEREWLADPQRTVAEGRALGLAAGIDAARVPEVVDLDEEHTVLVIAAAPAGGRDWKQDLLREQLDEQVAVGMGAFLGRLHRATTGLQLDAFDDWEPFEQLRVRPYFRTLVEDEPALEPLVLPHIAEMTRRRTCLVHGDVSPKNVLLAPGLLWLIDFEVAHHGDPAFDVAFMLCHLLLKSVHLPASADGYRSLAAAFVAAYAEAGGTAPDDEHLNALLGLLLMARVRGRSPAEYLTGPEQDTVWALGRRLAAGQAGWRQ